MSVDCACLRLELIFISDVLCTEWLNEKDCTTAYIHGNMYDALKLLQQNMKTVSSSLRTRSATTLITTICSLELHMQMCSQEFNAYSSITIEDSGWSYRLPHALQPLRVCSHSVFVSLSSLTCICSRELTSVGLHVLQQVVVELELDATGTTSVGF